MNFGILVNSLVQGGVSGLALVKNLTFVGVRIG